MTEKHTPGPWALDDSECGDLRLLDLEGRTLVLVPGCWPDRRDDDDPEAVANARLIAAAPDMLELLEDWARVLADGVNLAIQPGSYAHVMLRAAIAKAKGGEP